MPEAGRVGAVLFDLDGTLADTAPDLAAAANFLLAQAGRPQQSVEFFRPWASQGVRGLLRTGFGIAPDDAAYADLFARFLERYAEQLCVDTCLFPGMAALLDRIEATGAGWGIVTNKRQRYTDPLVAQLGLTPRTACVVSGDTTAAAKPSPLPVLHACNLLGVTPAASCFVGDDPRDIEAGRAAGCLTVAVTWGYLADHPPAATWGADYVADTPVQLADWLSLPAARK